MKENGSCTQSNFSSKKEGLLVPTPDQQKAAEVALFVKNANIFRKGSGIYVNEGSGITAGWKRTIQDFRARPLKTVIFHPLKTVSEVKGERKSLREKATTAFEELHKGDGKNNHIFRFKWGEDAERFENIFNALKPRFASAKEQTVDNAASMSQKDRILISIKAASFWGKLSSDQKDQLLTTVGYSRKELSDITKKIKFSMKLNAGLYGGFQAIIFTAGGSGIINPFLGGFSENSVKVIIGSYLAYGLSLAINAQQNLRLLRNESINTSPSAPATVAFLLSDKLFPRNKRLQDWSTRLASLSPEILEEVAWFLTIPFGPSIAVSANIAATGLYGLQAIASEVVLRRHRKLKGKDSERSV